MKKHGLYQHPLYKLWRRIKNRCFNESADCFSDYGGRGITIHPDWLNDPVAFIEWMESNLGERPPGYSIDRIDNDGDYEPGNLRWASRSDQNLNRRVKVVRNRKPGATCVPNVIQERSGRFVGMVWVRGKRYRTAVCDTIEEAASLVSQLRIELGVDR